MEGNVDVFCVGGEEEEIMDYDDGDDLNFSTDSEAEYEKNSDKQQEYPKTPQERITWQEHLRMIHLRSHLNQLAEKLKHAAYNVDKVKEELKKCRSHKHQLQNERDSFFKQMEEQESNKAAIYRLRAAHKRVCSELDEEEKLERTIQEQLEKAEYDLALVEAEKGKFILVEEELLQKEQQLAKEKMQSAHVRQQKEQRLAVNARIARMKDTRQKTQLMKEDQQRHHKVIEDAERSHKQASKYLKKTLEKMKRQQEVERERYQSEMQQKMDMLVKLKGDMGSIKENMKVIRARDKALELERQLKEAAEYQRILDEGGNADQQLNIKKRLNDQAEKKKMFEDKQLEQRTYILNRIIYEEKQLQKRKKRQPQLWNEPAWEKTLRVAPHKHKPVKLLEDYINSSYGEVKGGPELRDMTFMQEDEKQDEEKVVQEDEFRIPGDTDSSDDEAKEEREVNLAVPEFEGLWEQQILPPKVTREVQTCSKLPRTSKMDKEILEKVLKKHREHIVVKQIAGGREFHGCSFNSKPETIHFKDFDVGKTYKKKVVLTNVSYTVNYCRYAGMTERLKDFIKVKFDPPGQMSAGMTCDLVVTFKPMINESLFGEINFLSQTGPFSIPLHCTIKKCDLHLDVDKVDFGTAVIGETLKRSITLSNLGGLGTRFDFFKVTGMKQQTFTTGDISLGRLTSDSLQGVSADSEVTPEKGGHQGLDDIAEDLQEGSAEVVQGTSEILQAEGSELTDTAAVDTEVLADSEKMGPQELPEAASPDLAVSEVDYSLDGMRVGSVATGEIGPFSSVQLDIIWHPTIPGQVQSEFLVTFADTQAASLTVSVVANGINVPVWVERQSVDLKICAFDRLYQDTIIINNRATTALKLKFEVCRELHNYMEILPHTGYIQAQSQFSAQLKFLPRKSLGEDSKKCFDAETGVLEAPVLILVADQTNPVAFTVHAVVTNSEMEFDVQGIDFGHCSVYESVCTTVQLTNKSILPQQYGFLGLPEYVEVQPNDGFGMLLPLETIKLDVIFSPQKAYDYKFDLICKSVIDRDFKISCKGVGVLPPLQLSSQVIRFAATALFDVSTASLHVINSHKSTNEFAHPVPRIGTKGDIFPVGPTSFEFVVPQDAPVSISPAVGTVAPGEKALIQVRFRPSLSEDEIQQEMLCLKTRMEAMQLEQDEKLEKEILLEQTQKAGQTGSKQTKVMPLSPKTQALKGSKAALSSSSLSSRSKPASSNLSEQYSTAKSSPLHAAATASLLRQFDATVHTVVIPCYVASREPSGKLSHSIENTLYLEVRCPVVKPQLIVISDSGKTTVDFGEVSIGQSTYRSVTIQNISDKMVKLSSTILDTLGPFILVNALRVLTPEATHTMIISFTPTAGHVFQEPLQIKTGTSSLHLTLVGRGVSPVVRLSVENQLLDMGAVLVNEYVEKHFKIENTSSVAIDYVIKLDSLSYSHHSKAQSLPHFLHAQSNLTNYVGVQNYNGQNVFDVVPAEGTIPPGETKDIMVTFAPDHESIHYSDGIHIELFSEKESHFFQVTGEAQKKLLFIVGGDVLYPDVESLGVFSHSPAEEEVSTPVPFLLTLKSQMRNEEFVPATATVFVCCARTMSANQRKNGEFQFEGVQQLLPKGINIEPSKAMVEAGTKKPVVITWTPPQGHNFSKVQEELVSVTLRGDVAEQQQFVLHLLVVSA